MESTYNVRLHDGVLEGKDATLEQRLQQRLYGIHPPYAASPTVGKSRDDTTLGAKNSHPRTYREDSYLTSASQRRYLMYDGTDMLQQRDTMRSSLNDGNVRKNLQSALSEVILNMTISDSVDELKSNIASLKQELAKLCREEEAKKKEHNFFRVELQDAWDKLVNLRTHISLFRTAIEEATIEEVAQKAESEAWRRPDSPTGGVVALTVESALRLADIQAVREKIRLKEGLRRKLALIEEVLYDLRNKLSEFTEELTKASVVSDREIVPHSLDRTMELRHAIILISKDLEETEEEFVRTNREIELIELELSAALQRVDGQKAPSNQARSSQDDQTLTIHDAARQEDNIRLIANEVGHPVTAIALAMKGGKESATRASKGLNAASNRCDFSLHEVLSGDARVVRLNGEPARTFRARLEKRLSSLLILDEQLQTALEEKTEDVKRARELLRDVEVQRLRVELQLSNAENNLRQLELENMQISVQQAREAAAMESARRSKIDTARSSASSAVGTGRSNADEGSEGDHDHDPNRRLREAAELLREDLMDPTSEESKQARSRTPTKGSPQKSKAENSRTGNSPFSSPKRGTKEVAENRSRSPVSTARSGSPSKDTKNALSGRGDKSERSVMPIAGIVEDTSLSKRSVRKPEVVNSQLQDADHRTGRDAHRQRERSSSFDSPERGRSGSRDRSDPTAGGSGGSRRGRSHSPSPRSSSGRQSLIPVRTERDTSLTHSPLRRLNESSERPGSASRLRFADDLEGRKASGGSRAAGQQQHQQGRSQSAPAVRGRGSSSVSNSNSSRLPHAVGDVEFSSSLGSTMSSSGGFRSSGGIEPSLSEKLEKFKAKLAEAKREETVNPMTGIAVDIHRHGASLGFLEVAVIGARNLPEVKKITRSADPYVELRLATVTEGNGSEASGSSKQPPPAASSARTSGRDGNTVAATDVSVGTRAHASTVVEFKTGEDEDVDKVLRTAVQWQNRFPEWREFFKVAPITNLNQAVVLTVKDFSKMGLQRDEIIGQCALPLNMLLDQQHHRFWLQLQAPDFKKLWSGKIPQDCALRVECRLFYSKVKLWQYRIDELNELILCGDIEAAHAAGRRGLKSSPSGGRNFLSYSPETSRTMNEYRPSTAAPQGSSGPRSSAHTASSAVKRSPRKRFVDEYVPTLRPQDRPGSSQQRTVKRVLGLRERPVNVAPKSAFDVRVSRVEMRTADDVRRVRSPGTTTNRSRSLSRDPSGTVMSFDDFTAGARPSIQGGAKLSRKGSSTNNSATITMKNSAIQEIPIESRNHSALLGGGRSSQVPNLSIFKKAGAKEAPFTKSELKAQAKSSGAVAFGSKGRASMIPRAPIDHTATRQHPQGSGALV